MTPQVDPSGEDADEGDVASPIAKKKATFLLDATLHRRLKVRAAEEGRGMIELVEDAIERYLGGA